MSACVGLHTPRDADIILVEYSVNDVNTAEPVFDNNARRPFERLLRKLLALPHAPAVILVHSYAWFAQQQGAPGAFWSSAERELSDLGLYYDLPAISIRGCCYHAMRQGVDGFKVTNTSKANSGLRGDVFYHDLVNPDGMTGHRAYADLLIHLLQTTLSDLTPHPVSSEDAATAFAALRPPVIPGNYEGSANRCLIGPAFRKGAVVGADPAWEWVNESKGPRPKWGMVSTTIGSMLRLRVNTTATSGDSSAQVLVQLAHLKSYEHMGISLVRCQSGCSCPDHFFYGNQTARSSQLMLHNFYTSQAPECIISITVSADSHSSGHKVKVAGIIVSEESGQREGFAGSASVEYVHDMLNHAGAQGVFDVRNHT